MRCAITNRPLCDTCSDPVDTDELVTFDGEPYHDDPDCWPFAAARELEQATR